MSSVLQPTFAAGELSPSASERTDIARYYTGLKLCRNFMVMPYGGVRNRPGTEFVCEVKDSTKRCRLIPFQFNDVQTYVLAFGDLNMRVIKDGGQVVFSSWPNPSASSLASASIATLIWPSVGRRFGICAQIPRTPNSVWLSSFFSRPQARDKLHD